MADYTISTRIVAEDAVDAGVDSVERKLDNVERSGARVGASIMANLGRALAVIGGSAALGQASRYLVDINSELETATASMASLFTASFGMSMAQGLGLARSELQGLREDAAKGVGELANYTQAYQLLLSPVTGAGGSLEDVRRLTGQALAAGFALRGQQGLELAPMDITQALQQGVNERITPIASAALRAAGIDQGDFNKMGVAERMDALSAAFERFAPAVELMGQTWEAQMATLQDGVRNVLRDLSAPLFERWKEHLEDANTWLAANQDRVAQLTTMVGNTLVKVWDHVVDQARTYLALLTAAAVVQSSSTMREGLGGFVGSRLASVRQAGSGLRTAAADPLGITGIIGSGLAGFGAKAGGAGILSALGTLGTALMSLAGPAMLVVGAIMAVKGAFAEDLFGTAALVTESFAMLREAGGELLTSLAGLASAFTGISAEGSALNVIGAALLLFFANMVNMLTSLVQVGTKVVSVFAAFVEIVGGLLQTIGLAVRGDFAGAREAITAAWARAGDRLSNRSTGAGGGLGLGSFGDSIQSMKDTLAGGVAQLQIQGAQQRTLQGATVNVGTINVAVRAEVNEDPARVALAFDEVLSNVNRYRRAALRER